jgi:hypothetical protein
VYKDQGSLALVVVLICRYVDEVLMTASLRVSLIVIRDFVGRIRLRS